MVLNQTVTFCTQTQHNVLTSLSSTIPEAGDLCYARFACLLLRGKAMLSVMSVILSIGGGVLYPIIHWEPIVYCEGTQLPCSRHNGTGTWSSKKDQFRKD